MPEPIPFLGGEIRLDHDGEPDDIALGSGALSVHAERMDDGHVVVIVTDRETGDWLSLGLASDAPIGMVVETETADGDCHDYGFSMETRRAERYPVTLAWSGDAWIATAPDLPGCTADAPTRAAAAAKITSAIQAWIETARATDRPVPSPSTPSL